MTSGPAAIGATHRKKRFRTKEKRPSWSPYLIAVHFEFADHLDGDFSIFGRGILCAVDVAEGAVAHFLDQDPALQAGILGHLVPIHVFFGHQTFNFDGTVTSHLVLVLFLGCGGTVPSEVGVEGFQCGGELAVGLGVLLGVDGGNVGRGFRMGSHETGLFPMSNEVLYVLYCAHDGRDDREMQGRGAEEGRGVRRAAKKLAESRTRSREDEEKNPANQGSNKGKKGGVWGEESQKQAQADDAGDVIVIAVWPLDANFPTFTLTSSATADPPITGFSVSRFRPRGRFGRVFLAAFARPGKAEHGLGGADWW